MLSSTGMKRMTALSWAALVLAIAAGSEGAELVTVREGKLGKTRYKVTRDAVPARGEPSYTVAVIRADGTRIKREIFHRPPTLEAISDRPVQTGDRARELERRLVHADTNVVEKLETTTGGPGARFAGQPRLWNNFNLAHLNPALLRGENRIRQRQRAETARQQERAAREAALWPSAE